jgi:deoxyribonuclease V
MVDGHGLAHPRRFGIACHLGLLVGRPTVGAAKSILVGKFDEPAVARGSRTPIVHEDDVVGSALRTRDGVRPIFVTVGNLIDLESAVELVLRCHGGYRQPEPTRRAHVLVNRMRSGDEAV